MNVKQWVDNPVSRLFQALDQRKAEGFRGGFEPIPDVVLFTDAIRGDLRRRNCSQTLRHMLAAIEVKASERARSRLGPGEVRSDIDKLAAHRAEVKARSGEMIPVMMVIDTAPLVEERMTPHAIAACRARAVELDVDWYYVAANVEHHPDI
ncbi:hypothetical protein [Pannonibacter sp. SL95]|uniref:hypothetical protein n=1 Tax=Pannonibacter sp. SL95 TaxID=2995153 RepID=UPI00227261BA|nr:hypothetical protein [Pannonibacter sp. SL95]MCY1706314.1 hypothetical protein [Pannonibacter sp. SL95]